MQRVRGRLRKKYWIWASDNRWHVFGSDGISFCGDYGVRDHSVLRDQEIVHGTRPKGRYCVFCKKASNRIQLGG
jgi:hypothetical protein